MGGGACNLQQLVESPRAKHGWVDDVGSGGGGGGDDDDDEEEIREE